MAGSPGGAWSAGGWARTPAHGESRPDSSPIVSSAHWWRSRWARSRRTVPPRSGASGDDRFDIAGRDPVAAGRARERTVPGLTDLGDRDLARLAPLFDDVRIGAGKVLAREGQSSQALVLIVEGWAAGRYGKPIDALGPGQFLGEMSILDRAAHTATATARTPMRILLAGRENRNVAERARCPASDRDEPGQSTAVLRVPSDRPGHRVVVSETLCLAGIQAITAAEGPSSTW
jgi:Cyclic nucleotide-binding domain